MTKRKSFIVHKDSLDILEDLTDEQAGQLFKAIWKYQKGEDIKLSALVKVAFNPFKHQFVRDDEKYEAQCKKNKEIAINRYSTKNTKRNEALPTATKSTDNKNKNKNKNKSDKDIKAFVPNAASIDAVNSLYPNCDINSLIDDFKDQARNRAKPFKDLQSGFRNYVRKGWVMPRKNKEPQSFAEIQKMVYDQIDNEPKPLTLNELKKLAEEKTNVHN